MQAAAYVIIYLKSAADVHMYGILNWSAMRYLDFPFFTIDWEGTNFLVNLFYWKEGFCGWRELWTINQGMRCLQISRHWGQSYFIDLLIYSFLQRGSSFLQIDLEAFHPEIWTSVHNHRIQKLEACSRFIAIERTWLRKRQSRRNVDGDKIVEPARRRNPK